MELIGETWSCDELLIRKYMYVRVGNGCLGEYQCVEWKGVYYPLLWDPDLGAHPLHGYRN